VVQAIVFPPFETFIAASCSLVCQRGRVKLEG
jgi:hypothetical protein